MKNTIRGKFIAQGLEPSKVYLVFNKLAAAGTIRDGETTPHDLATALIGITTPTDCNAAKHVIAYMTLSDEQGNTLGEILEKSFSLPPAEIGILSMTVCHSFPWVIIDKMDGSRIEFTSKDFTPCPIRTETVITGGMISCLSMALHMPTESGWNQ